MGEGLALHMHVCMPMQVNIWILWKLLCILLDNIEINFQNMRDQQWNKMMFHLDAFTDNSSCNNVALLILHFDIYRLPKFQHFEKSETAMLSRLRQFLYFLAKLSQRLKKNSSIDLFCCLFLGLLLPMPYTFHTFISMHLQNHSCISTKLVTKHP